MNRPLAMLVAGSLSQLGAWHPVTERGGHIEECMAMARVGHVNWAHYGLRCEWHPRRWIDEMVKPR